MFHQIERLATPRRAFAAITFVTTLAVILLSINLHKAKNMLPSGSPDFGKLPLAFEPNAGQTDPSVRFLSRSAGGTLFFTPSEVAFSLPNVEVGVRSAEPGEVEAGTPNATASIAPPSVVRLQLLGADPDVALSGGALLPGRVNYFLGSDPSRWQSDLPTYKDILYSGLYPGVDLRYEGRGGSLKGTYILAVGADPSQIRWRYEGTGSVQPDGEGNIQIRLPGAEGAPGRVITEKAPAAWQELGGKRVPVESGYVVGQDGVIGFRMGSYDPHEALVIDPDVVYSSYLGGNNGEVGQGIAVDSSGNIYVTGWTTSANFPVLNPHQPANAGSHDGYVTKLDPTGSTLIFSTYLGGSAEDEPKKIAVDSLGNSVIAGGTYSANFPVTLNAYQPTYGSSGDGIVAYFGPTGSLLYSTYLGGANYDDAFGVRLVGAVAYLAGTTASSSFPVTLSAYQPTLAGSEDAFITELPLAGGPPIYSTFLGGSLADHGNAIAVDSGNNVYVTGGTISTDFPVANAYQSGHAGGVWDAFVAKLNAAGTTLAYSTYYGAAMQDIGHGIAVNSVGNAFVTGEFNGLSGAAQAFATRFSVSGATLDYENLYGATTGKSMGASIAVDGADNAYLIGETTDPLFPVVNAIQPTYAGGFYGDAFAMQLDPAGQTLYSTYLGGSSDEVGRDVAVSESGAYLGESSGEVMAGSGSRAYLVGDTGSTDFAVEGDAFQHTNPIFQDSRTTFLTVIDSSLPVPISAPLAINQAQDDQDAPRVDGVYVVWHDTRNGDSDIFAHNIAISQTFPVYVGPGEQGHPSVGGNLIAWEDDRNGNWDIYAVRITGPLSVTLPTPVSVEPGSQINPAAASKYTVWQSEALPPATATATPAATSTASPTVTATATLATVTANPATATATSTATATITAIPATATPTPATITPTPTATVTSTATSTAASTATPQSLNRYDIIGVVITDTIGIPVNMTLGSPNTNANPDISLYTADDGSLDNVTVWQSLPLTPITAPGGEGGSTRWGLQMLFNFDQGGTPVPVTLPTVTGGDQLYPSVSDRHIVWEEVYTPTIGSANGALGGSTRWGMYAILDATDLTTLFTIADDLDGPLYPRINSNQVVWQQFDPADQTWAVKVTDIINISPKVVVEGLELPPYPDNSGGTIVWQQKDQTFSNLAEGADLNIYGNVGIASPTATATACPIQFTDVPPSSTFYAQIRCLACRGILGGYSDSTFRPNNDMTRGQIAKVVSNAAGFNEDAGEQIYEDVPPTNTFYAWINRLSMRGYMGGYPCGTNVYEPCVAPGNRPYFRPFANATRGQLAKIVASAAQITGTPTGQRYADVAPGSTFYLWIEQLSSLGVMGGYACGSVPSEPCDGQNRPYFRPFNNVTRGQAAKIVANTFYPDCQTPALR